MHLLSRGLISVLLFAGLAAAQTSPQTIENKSPDVLHDLSAALEALSSHAGRAVVLISSTVFALNEEDDSGEAAMLTRQKSTGSGVIVSADGYIVTNAHVVKGGRRIEVPLADSVHGPAGHSVVRPAGKKVDAKIVGIDRDSDLAVLKIDRTG